MENCKECRQEIINIYDENFPLERIKDQKGVIIDDPINHPKHYVFGKFEVIDVLLDWFSDDPLLYNVGKYIARAKHKGKMLEDLKKAEFYLKKRIEMLEKENETN